MSNTNDGTTSNLLLRAFANLKAVRENLTRGYVHEEEFFQMFDAALDQLQQAGVDVTEWRFPADAVGNTDAGAFRAKIDAILTFFSLRQEKVEIGFHK